MPNTKNETKRRGTRTKTTPEFRLQLVNEYFIDNQDIKSICKRHRMADRTVRDIINRFKETQTVLYKPRGGDHCSKLSEEQSEYLRVLIDEEEDGNILTLEQLRDKLRNKFPEDFPTEKSISLTAISKHVDDKLALTLKRSTPLEIAQETERTQELRVEYCQNLLPQGINYMDNCIFVDESGFNYCMVPGRARSLKGKKAHVLTKTKRGKNITIIGAISPRRVESLQAVIINKGTNRFIFGEFIEQLLLWLDQEYKRPMVVIMDNVKFHKSQIIKDIFDRSQHRLHFLPPYSPMFNPIETCFSKLKNYVKRSPRTEKDAMLNLIKEAGATVTQEDCKNWVLHSINNINKCLRGENVTFDN